MMLKRMKCIKSAGQVSKPVQRLMLCAVLVTGGTFSAITVTDPSSGNSDPVRKTVVQPKYPRSAIEAKAESVVTLEFSIGANNGRPCDIQVVENTAQEAYRGG